MKFNIGKYTLEFAFGLTPIIPPPPEWTAEYVEAIKEGNLLRAVKFFKDKTGHGLKESKDYSDSVMYHYRTTGEIKLDFPIVKNTY